jgi:uncharacterized repeat protein (TIGR01451 family)
LGISKPDVTAPGIQILAGNTPAPATAAGGPPGQLFQAIAGTSMSSPHVAGSGALLKALHPNWTPGQIKSALMTTAKTQGLFKEDGETPFTPFEAGSGRINLTQAGDPGITFDVPALDYVTLANRLWDANYPSLYVPIMPGVITVQRTAHSELSHQSSWQIKVISAPSDVKISVPNHILIPGGGDATFDITVDARAVPIGQVRHATIRLKHGFREAHFPITIVRKQPIVSLDKSCDPATIARGATTTCTIELTNNSFDDANVSLTDQLPRQLKLIPASVVNATPQGNGIVFNGSLFGATSPIEVQPGASPFGYVALPGVGFNCPGNCDDVAFNLTGLGANGVRYNGVTYGTVGFSSNGFVQPGGATSATANNQRLPNTAGPNNVVAPFWTDLHPLGSDGNGAGKMFFANVNSGANNWLVIEWRDVVEFDGTLKYSFQIWMRRGGAVEDISFVYQKLEGDGAGGRATVGAENTTGTVGDSFYFNGTGTLPTVGNDLVVVISAGAPGETRVITFDATGDKKGAWTNCAEMTGDLFFGTNTACFSGNVTN